MNGLTTLAQKLGKYKTIIERARTNILVTTSVALFCGTMWLGYESMVYGSWPQAVVEYHSNVIQTDKLCYHPGDTVKLRMRFQKNFDIPGKVQWYLVDGKVTAFRPKDVGLPVGIYDHFIDGETIPLGTPSGRYHFEGTTTYQLPFRTVTYALKSTEFDIKGDECDDDTAGKR